MPQTWWSLAALIYWTHRVPEISALPSPVTNLEHPLALVIGECRASGIWISLFRIHANTFETLPAIRAHNRKNPQS
jgi:hypothetical protein